MGLGFVIFFHFVIIFIVSAITAIVAGILTRFISKKEKRKRRIIFAVISPFVGFYTLYITAIIGAFVVSAVKDVDIGTGDAWYVPLSNNCQLLFIDVPEEGFIQCGGSGASIIDRVVELQEINDKVFGVTSNDEYFLLNTKSNELNKYTSKSELQKHVSNQPLQFVEAYDFYLDRRSSVAGVWLTIVGVGALLVTILVLFVLRRLILRI